MSVSAPRICSKIITAIGVGSDSSLTKGEPMANVLATSMIIVIAVDF